MEQTLKVQSRKLNGKVAIIILSIAAIVLRIFAYFQTIGSNFFNMMNPFLPHSIFEMELSFEYFVKLFTSAHFPQYLLSFLTSLIVPTLFVIKDILPILLFVVYLAFFFKKSRATVLLPITFGALALGQIISLVNIIISFVSNCVKFCVSIGEFSIFPVISIFIGYLLSGIPYVIVTVVSVLLLVTSLKGCINKPLANIPCVIGIVALALNFVTVSFSLVISIITLISVGDDMAALPTLISSTATLLVSLCTIVFFIAILVFVAKNYVPEIIPMSDANLASLIKKNPKKAKNILTVRYESGKLSEEEYNARLFEMDTPATVE